MSSEACGHNNSDRVKAAIGRRGFFAVGAGVVAGALMGTGAQAAASDLNSLRAAVRGRVFLPGDSGFGQMSKAWDLSVNQAVRAVVEVADVEDARSLIRFGRENGIAIAVQPNGHGASEALNGTILVRTRSMNDVRIDPRTRSARVGAGVSWGPVQEAGAPFGLMGVSGSSPSVGVTGYTLGGGLSWFSRRFGWAAESVTAYEVINADSEIVRATEFSEPELFWSLRGGGGDYALVTGLEFALHPVTSLYGGTMLWPAARADDVLTAFREVTAMAPDELTVWCALLNLPGMEPAVGIYSTYLGSSDPRHTWLQPFERITGRVSDSHRMLRSVELGTITDEPTRPSPLIQRGAVLTSIDHPSISEIFAKPVEPLAFIQIRHLGGALSRGSDTAAGLVTDPYFIVLGGLPMAGQADATIRQRIAEDLDTLAPISSGRTPFTFLSSEQTAAEAFDSPTLTRLQEAKRRYDPHGVFRSNHPVLA